MAVYYSFHYDRDVNRVQMIRNIGSVEGQPLLNSQAWENVRRRGAAAIADWIEEQMSYKSAVIVLIGQETANRPWVQYEIQHAWDIKKPMLGIRIHGLSSFGETDSPGPDPFTQIDGCGGRNPGFDIFDPTVKDLWGCINSKATFNKLRDNLSYWAKQGKTRK